MKGFVAGLVLRDRFSVRPYSPDDRRGFAQVIRLLDQRIGELEKRGEDPKVLRQMFVLRMTCGKATPAGMKVSKQRCARYS